MKNILTIDVEDYFQVENFKEHISYEEWEDYNCRAVESTELILNILNEYNVQATFFVLGWIAEKYPKLVTKISRAGHEIATHGYYHQLVYKQTKEEFARDLDKSISLLTDITNQSILGYRAPSFSIVNDSIWALDIIKEAGLKYDASIFPIQGHDRYGVKEMEPSIHELESGLYEVPPTTVRFFGKRWPAAGGGYFRLFPYWLTKYFINRLNTRRNRPAVVYLHPWEFDPEQPRIEEADLFSKFRHYVNLHKTEEKFKQLLEDFEFTSIQNYLNLKAGDSND